MTSFVQPNYPTHHEGVERVGDGIDSATRAYKTLVGSRGTAIFALVAIVCGLILAANQLVDTWVDGHLLAVWVVLWAVIFAALALAAEPMRREVANLKNLDGSAMYAAWNVRRKAHIQDEKMWEYALHDKRLMADIMRSIEDSPEAARWHLRA